MIPIIVVLITVGGLGLLLTNASLLLDGDTAIYGGINMICTVLLCVGILVSFNKTQTVYCPECGDKKDPIVVDIDERYCSACGNEYIVVD